MFYHHTGVSVPSFNVLNNAALVEQLKFYSSNYSKPGLVKDACAGFLSETDIVHALRSIANTETVTSPYFRVMKDNGTQLDLAQKLIQHPPQESEGISRWLSTLFPGEDVCIVINQLHRFITDLNQRLEYLYQPIKQCFTHSKVLLQPALILGDYNYTPLGIHEDGEGISVIHFHLGPAPKHMSFWPRALLAELTGSTDRFFDSNPRQQHNYQSLIPHANSWTINAGDAFYIPANIPHIGHASGYSASFLIIIEQPSEQIWRRLAVERLLVKLSASSAPAPDWLIDASEQLENELTKHGGTIPADKSR